MKSSDREQKIATFIDKYSPDMAGASSCLSFTNALAISAWLCTGVRPLQRAPLALRRPNGRLASYFL